MADNSGRYPAGVVLHIPHSSAVIPEGVRSQFFLDDIELDAELALMTDHRTDEIFCGADPGVPATVARFSRLVVDVERFEQDDREPMAKKGMGMVYGLTSNGRPLRRELSAEERELLVSEYYRPHHQQFADAVDGCLRKHGRVLIIDGHSFPSHPLPYEPDQNPDRPDICIGSDDFHTPAWAVNAFVRCFEDAGFGVAVNHPFSGAIVPGKHYRREKRVVSVMVEINKHLYLDQTTSITRGKYVAIAGRIRKACRLASSLVLNRSFTSS